MEVRPRLVQPSYPEPPTEIAAPGRRRSKISFFAREHVVGLLGDDHQIAARPQVVHGRRDDDARVAEQGLL